MGVPADAGESGTGVRTEASKALLGLAGETFSGDLLAIIDPRNRPSQNVCRKLGFTFWKQEMVDAVLRNSYTLPIASTGKQEPTR